MKLARINVGLLALGAISMVAGTAAAAVNPDSPKVLLHVKATTVKNQCSILALGDNCANAVTKGGLYPTFYHVQLITDRGDSLPSDSGIAGVQVGLAYSGGANPGGGETPIDIFSWSLCATLEFASPAPFPWPGPNSGNLITWDAVGSCQRNRLACAGYFYMGAYGPSTLRLIKRPADQLAKVADCGSLEVLLPEGALGFAAFSSGATTEGCNPCLTDCAPVAVAPATWSKVKSLLH